MSTAPAPLPAPLYQGSVNTWECDDGGHLNIRFHLERAYIGLAHMAHALEIPRAFTSAAASTLTPLELHVRFNKEALPGAPLVMHGGVAEMGETNAKFCLDMRHADCASSSSFTIKVAHTDTRDFRAFGWSPRTREAAKRLQVELPPHAKPRSVDVTKAPSEASRDRALELGALRIGGAMVLAEHCDTFGRMRFDHLMGRVSDSVPNLLAQWRADAAADKGAAPAGAVVEARYIYRQWPRPGDLIEIYSGIIEVGEKTLRLVHWLCDPASGKTWMSMEVTALTFDIATRKTISPSPEVRARMEKRLVKLAI